VSEPPSNSVCRPAQPRWAAETHIGKVRQENQDRFFIDPDVCLFLVSDGMGGHRGGAVASRIIAEDLPVMIENALERLEKPSIRTVKNILERSIAEQSRQLRLEGTSELGYRDMGATIVVALLHGGRCYIANVGDSRAYLLRRGRLKQLTRDHSVTSELIEQGRLKPEDARDHSTAGQVTRYMGMEQRAHPHVRSFTLKPGDRILLCTDGLTDLVDEACIAQTLEALAEPRDAARALVAAANDAGGHDNVTALVIHCQPR